MMKDCANCKHGFNNVSHPICCECSNYNNWEKEVNVVNETYNEIINHFGVTNQVDKCYEELGELMEELEKYGLDCFDREKAKGEIIDVINMLIQMILIYDISKKEIIEGMAKKNKRTLERIEEGYYE